MQTNELTKDKLRRLAELRPESGKALSFYLNLDPSEVATAEARISKMRSLVTEADRRLKDADGLSHDERTALSDDIGRVRSFLLNGSFSLKGAHAVALFVCGPADLFEAIKLPRAIESDVLIDDSPYIEPLADLASVGQWCVLLVNRRRSRILRGSVEGFEQIADFTDDVHGQHDQGGWSQARYQRSVDNEAAAHVKRTADALFRRFRYRPFDRLLIGCPEEQWPDVEAKLH